MTGEGGELERLRAALVKIAHLGVDEAGTVGLSCRWHHEASEVARAALAECEALEVERVDEDRTVHARGADGRQVVRYDRAGKWWLERADGTKAPLGVATAVSEALAIACEGGGDVYWGQPGGLVFDARLKRQLAQVRRRG